MAQIITHMEDCERMLGKPYKEVHQWLDYYARIFTIRPYLAYHRFFRHNKRGLLYIKNRWGTLGCDAGKVHLIRDFADFLLNTAMNNIRYNQIDKLCGEALILCNDAELTAPMVPQWLATEMREFRIGMVRILNKKGE